ncbi:MAG: hypothetical protein R3321_07470, partial [Nitrososphaeraceae archaeon]|nr:hypothetical protein [Nitrososphaeraceae archaeon]
MQKSTYIVLLLFSILLTGGIFSIIQKTIPEVLADNDEKTNEPDSSYEVNRYSNYDTYEDEYENYDYENVYQNNDYENYV